MKEKIKKILAIAVNAPSGDNSQPWKFKLLDNGLEVFNQPQADDTQYNFHQRGSLLAHGALLENVCLLAETEGLKPTITLFPNGTNSNLTARVLFEAFQPAKKNWAEIIELRATNRKAYKSQHLAKEFCDQIQSLNQTGKIKVLLNQEPRDIERLAKALSYNEKLILENPFIHREIFKFIRWSKQAMQKTKDGHDIKSLELEPPQEMAFKVFSHWPILKFLNRFHVSKLVTNETEKVYRSSACYGLITAPDLEPITLIQAGRLFEKIWLTATQSGVNLQPTTALLYLNQRVTEQQADKLTPEQINIVKTANKVITEVFRAHEQPLMLFRMGYCQPPTARSLKKPPLYLP
ncbi:MAG: nitroreductase family protein [Patescibacteria group bacterium]|nr:nitroreductase family protein [Patescibacteria group bacterium]